MLGLLIAVTYKRAKIMHQNKETNKPIFNDDGTFEYGTRSYTIHQVGNLRSPAVQTLVRSGYLSSKIGLNLTLTQRKTIETPQILGAIFNKKVNIEDTLTWSFQNRSEKVSEFSEYKNFQLNTENKLQIEEIIKNKPIKAKDSLEKELLEVFNLEVFNAVVEKLGREEKENIKKIDTKESKVNESTEMRLVKFHQPEQSFNIHSLFNRSKPLKPITVSKDTMQQLMGNFLNINPKVGMNSEKFSQEVINSTLKILKDVEKSEEMNLEKKENEPLKPLPLKNKRAFDEAMADLVKLVECCILAGVCSAMPGSSVVIAPLCLWFLVSFISNIFSASLRTFEKSLGNNLNRNTMLAFFAILGASICLITMVPDESAALNFLKMGTGLSSFMLMFTFCKTIALSFRDTLATAFSDLNAYLQENKSEALMLGVFFLSNSALSMMGINAPIIGHILNLIVAVEPLSKHSVHSFFFGGNGKMDTNEKVQEKIIDDSMEKIPVPTL